MLGKSSVQTFLMVGSLVYYNAFWNEIMQHSLTRGHVTQASLK